MPDDVSWLLSPIGLAATEQAHQRLQSGEDVLAINTMLRRTFPPSFVPLALQAAAARRRAMDSWPHASQLVFLREALEQASHPHVAAWRAHRLRDARLVWDLTAGIGGDTLAMAGTVPAVVAVDRDPTRLAILGHNARVLGMSVECVQADALEITVDDQAAVHVDPSRRRDGKRVSGLDQVRPAVDALLDHHRGVQRWSIATSPGLRWHDPVLERAHAKMRSLPHELEFVQLGGDLVEATWWIGGATARPFASATIISASIHDDPFSDVVESFKGWPGNASPNTLWAHRLEHDPGASETVASATRMTVDTAPLADILIEVAPAAVRARLHDRLGARLGAWRFDEHRALLTSDRFPPASVWTTSHVIETVLPANPKAIRTWLRKHDDETVELAVYGMDVDPTDWWRQLGKPRRGPQGLRIALVRLTNRSVAIITRRPEG